MRWGSRTGNGDCPGCGAVTWRLIGRGRKATPTTVLRLMECLSCERRYIQVQTMVKPNDLLKMMPSLSSARMPGSKA